MRSALYLPELIRATRAPAPDLCPRIARDPTTEEGQARKRHFPLSDFSTQHSAICDSQLYLRRARG